MEVECTNFTINFKHFPRFIMDVVKLKKKTETIDIQENIQSLHNSTVELEVSRRNTENVIRKSHFIMKEVRVSINEVSKDQHWSEV